MIATLRTLLRRLTDPTGRRLIALLLVAGLWALWLTKNQGRTLVVRTWDLPTGWPPAWLSIVTAVGLLLVIADRRRGRPCGNYSIQMT